MFHCNCSNLDRDCIIKKPKVIGKEKYNEDFPGNSKILAEKELTDDQVADY